MILVATGDDISKWGEPPRFGKYHGYVTPADAGEPDNLAADPTRKKYPDATVTVKKHAYLMDGDVAESRGGPGPKQIIDVGLIRDNRGT